MKMSIPPEFHDRIIQAYAIDEGATKEDALSSFLRLLGDLGFYLPVLAMSQAYPTDPSVTCSTYHFDRVSCPFESIHQ